MRLWRLVLVLARYHRLAQVLVLLPLQISTPLPKALRLHRLQLQLQHQHQRPRPDSNQAMEPRYWMARQTHMAVVGRYYQRYPLAGCCADVDSISGADRRMTPPSGSPSAVRPSGVCCCGGDWDDDERGDCAAALGECGDSECGDDRGARGNARGERGERDDIHGPRSAHFSTRVRIPRDRDLETEGSLKTPTPIDPPSHLRPPFGGAGARGRSRSRSHDGPHRRAFAVWGQDESDSAASDSDADA